MAVGVNSSSSSKKTLRGGFSAWSAEILSHRLHEITREMGATLERVGGTVNTTQLHDYMASLYMANGDVLSVGESMIRHAACAGFAVKRIIERFEGNGGIYPGDVFLLNDPYLAAIHQSDIYMIAPIHYQGRLMAWSATFVHVMDIGAMSPGGNSPGATEICHEGLRIPGLKLVERGRIRQDVFDTLINMTRQPVLVGLDLKCELAANNVARSRMEEMLAQYGPELITAVSSEMIRYSGAVLRKRLREIPDGTWRDEGTIAANETRRVCVELASAATAWCSTSPAATHRRGRASTCRTTPPSAGASRRCSPPWATTCPRTTAPSAPSRSSPRRGRW